MQPRTEGFVGLVRTRQARFIDRLHALDLPAGALITSREHFTYLTGFWPNINRPAAAWIAADGRVHAAVASEDVAEIPRGTVDSVEPYTLQRDGTRVDDPRGVAIQTAASRLPAGDAAGFDATPPPGEVRRVVNLTHELLTLRRIKDAAEVESIRRAVAVLEAVYGHVRGVLRPGMTEVELCAECYAAAVRAAGGQIEWLGNDFQAGTGGGPPRDRACDEGELLPLDLGITVDGYHADLCRTFCIGGHPTPGQQQAFDEVNTALLEAERQLRPGARCRVLHEVALARLDGFEGLKFNHHLGHGIGLAPHEAPRLNRHWHDQLEPGNTITLEPGLYGPSIRGGIRLEQDYLITETGAEKLSRFPLDL